MPATSSSVERSMTIRALLNLAVTAWIGSQFAGGGTSRTAAAVTYVVILVVSIVLHELAHALVGALVGAQVTGMRLGFGPRLTPPAAWLDLRPIIVAAHVTYIPPRGAGRPRIFAIAVAGLVLHALLIAVALALGTGHTWVRELLFANLLALVSNAIPLAGGFGLTSTSAGPNDGMHLLQLLAHRGAYLSAADPDWQAAIVAYDRGGLAAAQGFLTGLNRTDVPYLRLRLGEALLAAGRFSDAAAVLAGAADPARPWAANHLYAEAEAMAMLTTPATPDPVRVARAAAQAEAGMAAIAAHAPGPQRAAVAHTLALVRVLQARWADAEQIAGWSLAATEGADRAAVLATLGWSRLALGDRSGAEALLHQAMSLGRGPLVHVLAGRLAATPV
jgi:tetratricopeptide (TPR) repeat protein